MSEAKKGRVVGLDFGEKTIGVAISDPMRVLAQPFSALARSSMQKDIQALGKIIQDQEATEIVMGLPLHMNGEESAMAKKALAFAEALKKNLDLPVHTWDERLSTRAAERSLLEGDVRRDKRKKLIDQVAASLILQGWLDAQKSRP